MAILPILHFPDPRLRKPAHAVAAIDDEHRQLVDDMLETMYAAPGVGLAATQVGVAIRLIVFDVSETRDTPQSLFNPQVLATDGSSEREEGCLSVPGVYETVTRAESVRVRGRDQDGKTVEFEAEGFLSHCIQHEIDHLDGKLFVDYLSGLKRSRIRKQALKRRRENS